MKLSNLIGLETVITGDDANIIFRLVSPTNAEELTPVYCYLDLTIPTANIIIELKHLDI